MAKFISQVYSDIKGSVGGITYQKGNSGIQTVRSKPIAPRSGSNFSGMSTNALQEANALWKSLSKVLQDGWHIYAQSVLYSDAIGNYFLDGRDLFLSNHSFINYAISRNRFDGSVSLAAPRLPGWFKVGPIIVTAWMTGGFGVRLFITNPHPFQIYAYVWRSQPLKLTVNNFYGNYKAATMNNFQISADSGSEIVFPSLQLGSAFFFKIRCVPRFGRRLMSKTFYLRSVSAPVP